MGSSIATAPEGDESNWIPSAGKRPLSAIGQEPRLTSAIGRAFKRSLLAFAKSCAANPATGEFSSRESGLGEDVQARMEDTRWLDGVDVCRSVVRDDITRVPSRPEPLWIWFIEDAHIGNA